MQFSPRPQGWQAGKTAIRGCNSRRGLNNAWVVESVYTKDLKSFALTGLRVRVSPQAQYQNMAQISKRLGENIKHIRLKKRMSQGDICRAIEMDRSYMSAIEGGKVNVTLAVLEKLANALDVSVDELLK